MARVLVIWTRPHHLSAAEADAWVRTEVARIASVDGVVCARLTRLMSPATGHPSPGDWLCELHLRHDANSDRCLAQPALAEWLGDLRLLGMRPTVAITQSSELAR